MLEVRQTQRTRQSSRLKGGGTANDVKDLCAEVSQLTVTMAKLCVADFASEKKAFVGHFCGGYGGEVEVRQMLLFCPFRSGGGSKRAVRAGEAVVQGRAQRVFRAKTIWKRVLVEAWRRRGAGAAFSEGHRRAGEVGHAPRGGSAGRAVANRPPLAALHCAARSRVRARVHAVGRALAAPFETMQALAAVLTRAVQSARAGAARASPQLFPLLAASPF
ncbi:hypothetical protein FGB62_17g537 [Gracilaria domingensis]|nr:hypothetical protein FGB62_17g537 [Gracilaria domingensis]